MKNLNVNLFGKVLLKREIAGLVLAETAYTPHLKLSAHSHSHSYFCFVMKGNYDEFYDKKTRFCKPSMLIFHPRGEVHANRFYDAGGRCFNIQPASQWLERVNFNDSMDSANTNVKNLVHRLYLECVRFDKFSRLAVEGLFLEMAAEISRARMIKQTAVAPWLARVKEILHEQFAENLTLENIAREVSVHPIYLARAFRQKFQCTVGDYARALRVEYARRELSNSKKPLAEIAYLAGFASQSHFCTVFKRCIGETPAQFRKKS
ncbi:MAG: helix-turn-helix domain-containing protein [Pyrinomonadaceae bacterium]